MRFVSGEAYISGRTGTVAGAQVAAGLRPYYYPRSTLHGDTRRTVWPSVTACLVNVAPTVLVAGI